jgi:hypothetical protein
MRYLDVGPQRGLLTGHEADRESDPIFLRIELVKACLAWQVEHFNQLLSGVHFLPGISEITIPQQWIETIKLSDRIVNEAVWELLTTAPTTLQGVVAVLDYVGSSDPEMEETRLFEFADSNVRAAAMRFPKFLAETIQRLVRKELSNSGAEALITKPRNRAEESKSPPHVVRLVPKPD